MKPLFFALLCASSSLVACDNDEQDIAPDKVPTEVTAALAKAFPNATDLEWEKKAADYEADFDINTVEHSALLSASGEILLQKRDIVATELPEPVKMSISQNYAAYRIDDAEVVEKDGTLFYQVDLEKNNTEQKVVLAADGQVQNKMTYWD
ncbi:PepSY-like domain-containing protein [Pontibacter rugosus]|uniref:PepSY-like domain-containing protein n=1 Tax=Pontibacter rugosus TaxID=1745966 RepID=A0ABW3SU36_9BACT